MTTDTYKHTVTELPFVPPVSPGEPRYAFDVILGLRCSAQERDRFASLAARRHDMMCWAGESDPELAVGIGTQAFNEKGRLFCG